MLFVSSEKSKQEEVSTLLKLIYNGTKKSYPNGMMMMFIPIQDIYKNDIEFQSKIQFNHEKYIGDETLFCIGGVNNLNTIIKLKNGQSISIRLLIKSIPASAGMFRPQLFQQAEPNHGAMVTIVTFQASDRELVMARQSTLEEEICTVIASDQGNIIFTNDSEGIWFGGVFNTKNGQQTPHQKTINKFNMEYLAHINRIMHSPPKKRILNLPKWGGGIPPSTHPTTTTSIPSTHIPKAPATSYTPDEVQTKFDKICLEINEQRECNARFDARISSLEPSTRSIDSKIDLVLARLAPPDSPTHKIQKTILSQTADASSYPGRTSPFIHSSGLMET